VLEITLLVVSLALVDSVNPVTIAVALYLGSDERPHSRVAGFAAGVLGVYGVGGAALLLGPAQLLSTAVSSSETPAFHTASVAAGAGMVILALVIMRRGRAASLTAAVDRLSPRSALALGATVTVLDLPTAFPYFGAIATLANSGAPVGGQVGLLAVFNLLYVLPLIVIAVLPAVAGGRWHALVGRVRLALDRVAPAAVAGLTALMGGALMVRGADGLLS
jgi:cytochrome c biogenesis protein CcdA